MTAAKLDVVSRGRRSGRPIFRSQQRGKVHRTRLFTKRQPKFDKTQNFDFDRNAALVVHIDCDFTMVLKVRTNCPKAISECVEIDVIDFNLPDIRARQTVGNLVPGPIATEVDV